MEGIARISRPGSKASTRSATHKGTSAISRPGSRASRAQSALPTRAPRAQGSRAQSAMPNRRDQRGGGRRIARNESDSALMSGWELNFIKNISIDEKLKGSGNKPRPSNARRKRMESLQRMEVPRKVQPLTALERKLLDRSQEALAMKNIMKNAETLQARDHQLFERKRKQEDELRYEGEMHDMMIEDQQNALRDQVRQDELKALKGKERARVINAQLEDRQEQRLQRADEIEYEKEDFRIACIAREEEESRKKEAKFQVAKQMKADLVVSNKRAMKEKLLRQQRERDADMEILAYQRDKSFREELVIQEKARSKREKDEEFAKMMLAQEKFTDMRGAQDEARMLAAYREKEAQHWRKSKAKKAKKARELQELKSGWELQKQQKAALIMRQANMDRWETTNQEQAAYAAQRKLDDVADRKTRAAIQNKEDVEEQMNTRKERRKKGARNHRNMENDSHKSQQEKSNNLEKIRAESIEKMKAAGIPRVYWKKLEGKKLGLAREITPADEHTF